MFAIKWNIPKRLNEFPEHSQSSYIHSVIRYGYDIQIPDSVYSLAHLGKHAYIINIVLRQSELLNLENKKLISKYKDVFGLKEKTEDLIEFYLKYYFNSIRHNELNHYFLVFKNGHNEQFIYSIINLFHRLILNQLPKELVYKIFTFLTYRDILKIRY